MADHLTIDRDTDSQGYWVYFVKDEISGQTSGRRFRSRWRAEQKLEDQRQWATKTRPSNPDSMVRWLYGFPLLEEHN